MNVNVNAKNVRARVMDGVNHAFLCSNASNGMVVHDVNANMDNECSGDNVILCAHILHINNVYMDKYMVVDVDLDDDVDVITFNANGNAACVAIIQLE